MKETVYNLFLYVEQSLIKALGVAIHELDGTQEEKVSALRVLVEQDYKTARKYKVTGKFEWSEYEGRMRLGRELEVFEEIFRDCKAPSNPLVVITPIVDEAPRILAVTTLGPLNLEELQGTPLAKPGAMVDYLKQYVEDGKFDIPRLINDDYFLAIKLLFNAGHYVSAAKLLMSFVDTVAFIDAGDVPDSFCLWLDSYAELAPLGITAKELWEFRNGLLHMTNLRSRAVTSGRTVPLILYVGSMPHPIPASQSVAKYFNLKDLIDVLAAALSRWMESYNRTPGKLINFVNRYDLTISDSRLAYFSDGETTTSFTSGHPLPPVRPLPTTTR